MTRFHDCSNSTPTVDIAIKAASQIRHSFHRRRASATSMLMPATTIAMRMGGRSDIRVSRPMTGRRRPRLLRVTVNDVGPEHVLSPAQDRCALVPPLVGEKQSGADLWVD